METFPALLRTKKKLKKHEKNYKILILYKLGTD